MDKWVVAVAAGATSRTQHFKIFNQTSEPITSESSSVHDSVIDKPSDKKRPSLRRMSRRERLKRDDSEGVKKRFSKKQQSYAQEKNRFSDAKLLVCLGMSVGILYSFMQHQREVEKLNRLLKQKQNLVQDLEEKIEMKDSVMMQELKIDDHKSQTTDDGESLHSVSNQHGNKDYVSIKEKHDSSFKRIEEELEAELEMLELSMTSSDLERKISNLVELDPDFKPGVAQGELRAKILEQNHDKDERKITTTSHSANYMVSPIELSLRLHEVLQSRLEERIRELEAEIEAQNHKSWKDSSSSNAGDENHEDEPVVLNLSGEAIEGYNEACNEFAKSDDSDEEFDDNGTSRNGGATGDDDEDEVLIKHIVEKARQGSPAVLNAQRALFSDYRLKS